MLPTPQASTTPALNGSLLMSWILFGHLILAHLKSSAPLQLNWRVCALVLPPVRRGKCCWGALAEVFAPCLFWMSETPTLFPVHTA